MKRPVLIILIYYLAGILAGRYLSELGIVPFAFVFVLPFIGFVIKRERVLIIAPVFMVLGFALTASALKEVTVNEGEMNVEGVIYEITYSQSGTQRLDIKTEDGMVIRVMSDKHYNADIGDVIAVKGRAVLADKPTNPGEFDDYTYLRRENIDFRLYAEKLYKTGEKGMYLKRILFKVKSLLNDSIDRLYTSENSALVKAVVTGDKSFISDSLRTLYTEGGAIHILCVSGLHVGVIIAALSYFIKRILRIKGVAAEIIIDLLLVLYVIFIGFTASVVRAVAMAVIVNTAPKKAEKATDLIISMLRHL